MTTLLYLLLCSKCKRERFLLSFYFPPHEVSLARVLQTAADFHRLDFSVTLRCWFSFSSAMHPPPAAPPSPSWYLCHKPRRVPFLTSFCVAFLEPPPSLLKIHERLKRNVGSFKIVTDSVEASRRFFQRFLHYS